LREEETLDGFKLSQAFTGNKEKEKHCAAQKYASECHLMKKRNSKTQKQNK